MSDTNPGFKSAVMYYGVSMLPRLRGMTRAQLQALTAQASEVSGHVPVHMHPEADLSVPLWSSEPVSGGGVAALMCFGLWVLCGEDERVASPLLESWPIRDALTLCDGPDGERRVAPYVPPAEAPPPAADPEQFPLLALLDAAAARGVPVSTLPGQLVCSIIY